MSANGYPPDVLDKAQDDKQTQEFLWEKHDHYLRHLDDDKESLEYMMTEHLRMGGIYWGVSAMALLRRLNDQQRRDEIIDWIFRCRDSKTAGGFGPNVGHDADITATHYALLVLCIYDGLEQLDREGVVAFIAGLQQEDGSFAGDRWGEVDVRFAYCALSSLTILDALDRVNVDACVDWILRCMNYEGAFGPVPMAESHAAYVFCAVQDCRDPGVVALSVGGAASRAQERRGTPITLALNIATGDEAEVAPATEQGENSFDQPYELGGDLDFEDVGLENFSDFSVFGDLDETLADAHKSVDDEAAGSTGVSVVDKSRELNAVIGSSFSHVGRTAPDSVVSDAIRLTEKRKVLYPWEKGRMARIFGDLGRLEPKKPRLHPTTNSFVKVDLEISEGLQCKTAISVQPFCSDKAIYSGVVKHIIGGSYIEERASKRSHAVSQWWDMLKLDMRCSDPGRMAMKEKGMVEVYRNGIEIVDASLGIKSPNTTMKRLYTVKTYNLWLIRNYGHHWLPITERLVWLYFKAMKEEKSPATRATSFLEAVRFCHFVFRIDGCSSVLESLRVRGLAQQLYAHKRPWRPADALQVSEVVLLHRLLLDPNRSKIDRIFIGHILHMVYSRSRFSDLLAVTECMLDEEKMYFELYASVHKGARSSEAKAMLLPVVSPAHGIRGGCWVEDYIQLRKEMGLELPGREPRPMLPAPERGGTGWQGRYFTSQEMNTFMKKLFAGEGISLEGRRISTHSCKATVISWCAKHDVSPEHRAILARHSTSVQGATALYSRDLITAAMRSLDKVLEAIRMQTFFPDRSRSGMITPVPVAAGVDAARVVPETPLPAMKSAANEADAPQLVVQSPESIVPSPESPLVETPKSWECVGTTPATQQESERRQWPECSLDELEKGNEADEPPNLLEDWEGQSSDSDSDSTSESQASSWGGDDLQSDPPKADIAASLKYFINGSTLVIHERRSDGLFKCGRSIGSSYFPVHELNGLRCGKCFAGQI
eukprot:s1151_g32.t1